MYYSSSSNYNLNDTSYPMFSIVVLHEALHILGVINTTTNSHVSTYGNYNLWTGPNGKQGYIDVMSNNSRPTSNILGIVLEDDFDSGTKNVHHNEGVEEDGSLETVIIYDGYNTITHHSLRNEIMSGFINNPDNYLTPMTTGVLVDLGFGINTSSQYIVLTGSNMLIHP